MAFGEKPGECDATRVQPDAGRFWYGRAVEEDPAVRMYAQERRQALANSTVIDIVPELAGA
jgi:hypothetical protein